MFWVCLALSASSEFTENKLFKSSFEVVAHASKYTVERCAFYKINGKGLILQTPDRTAFTVTNCGFFQCRESAISCEAKELALRLSCFDECNGDVHAAGEDSVELQDNFFSHTNGQECVYSEGKTVNIFRCNLSYGFASTAITVVSDQMDLNYLVSLGMATTCWLSVQRDKGMEYLIQNSLVSADGARMEGIVETSPNLVINNCGIYTASNIVKKGTCTFIACSFSESEDNVRKACPNSQLRDCLYSQTAGDYKVENPPKSDECWALMPTPTQPKSSNGLIVGGILTLIVVTVLVALVVLKCLCGNRNAHKRPVLYM